MLQQCAIEIRRKSKPISKPVVDNCVAGFHDAAVHSSQRSSCPRNVERNRLPRGCPVLPKGFRSVLCPSSKNDANVSSCSIGVLSYEKVLCSFLSGKKVEVVVLGLKPGLRVGAFSNERTGVVPRINY